MKFTNTTDNVLGKGTSQTGEKFENIEVLECNQEMRMRRANTCIETSSESG